MATTSFKSKIKRFFKRKQNECESDDSNYDIKCFKDSQELEQAFSHRNRGIRTVALSAIVGSVGRYNDFDNTFRLKQYMPSERLQRIKEGMRQGKNFGPVKLYQIKDEYYVLDGNHRIAAAKELGHDEILADIVEFIPSKNTLQNILYRERAQFADKTQIPAQIDLTEVAQYNYLIQQIEEHLKHMQSNVSRPVTFQEAAFDWYNSIYRPLCSIIKKEKLADSFPDRTISDLYAYISHHQWALGRERSYGSAIDELIPKEMEEFRTKMANLKDFEYPEMKRGITAFILMSVSARKEYRIIDKLFALEEVKEVHSVHGDVDLLVKIILKRDLLSSDAEMISEFVHEKVRQLPGVRTTKTLIPGYSKLKAAE